MSDFDSFKSANEIRAKCQQLKASSGRKTGEALEKFYDMFEKVKAKANLKMILFIYLKGNTQGDKGKLTEFGNKLKELGILF